MQAWWTMAEKETKMVGMSGTMTPIPMTGSNEISLHSS
jgi:hypothetical protein